jgi:hypothetical protein
MDEGGMASPTTKDWRGPKLTAVALGLFILAFLIWDTTTALAFGLPVSVVLLGLLMFVALAISVAYIRPRESLSESVSATHGELE